MILTVTLNPAVDKTYTAALLLPGQVNRMKTVRNLPGGKGINVTKLLRQYGHEVMACGFLGGYNGAFIRKSMEELRVDCRFTETAEETRCSINVIAEDGYITELLEPGPGISEAELACFKEGYRKALQEAELVVLSGSVAGGISADIYGDLIRMASEAGKKTFLDTSGEPLVLGAAAGPCMIKPNLKELEYLAGHKIKGVEDAAEVALRFKDQGVETVVVSMGRKGLLAVRGEEALWARAPKVRTVNTVGCGDSVVGSWVMSYLRQDSLEDSLRQAAAIAAANAATMESGTISRELAEELASQIEISSLK